MRKAKIICTIGPASESRDMLRKLIAAGMNVARLNFSHGDHVEQGNRIRLLRDLRAETRSPLAIMLDTKGPEIRLGKFERGQEELFAGQAFTLTARELMGTKDIVSVSYPGLARDVRPGTQILLDDGLIELTVNAVDGDDIRCTVQNPGIIKDKKGVNLPGTQISIPHLSPKDRDDIAFGCEMGVDYIAASFVQSAQDVKHIRAILEARGAAHIGIIAKIESRSGVDNFEEILEAADGIMVARGDLGVEIPIEEVPAVQKRLIHLCNIVAKPVITATQMLESMIHNPRPTRAEANDVANSLLDGSDAIMLSGETASGSFPLEAVRTMDRIAKSIHAVPRRIPTGVSRTINAAVCRACVSIAEDLGAKAIITPTKSGTTAIMVARHRPDCPIIACAISESAYHRLSLLWGVFPLLTPEVETTEQLTERCVAQVREHCGLTDGDIVVITAGVPLSLAGTTNLIHVKFVGNVLMRGESVHSLTRVL